MIKRVYAFMRQVLSFARRHLAISTVVVLVVVVTASAYLFKKKPTPPDTFTAVRGNVIQEVSVTGNTKAVESVDLAFEKSGRVVQVNVSVGDPAYAGQALVVLDQSDLNAQLHEAEAGVAAANAKLDELVRGTRPEEIAIAEVKVENAKIALQDAQKSAVDTLQDAYTKSDDAVRNRVDQFMSNARSANPQLSFTIADSQLKSSIEQQRQAIEQLLVLWSGQLAGLSTSSDLETYLAAAKQSLDRITSFMDTAAFVVNSLNQNSNLSQTTINGYRADVATGRANVNTAITNVTAADEKLRSAESDLTLEQNQLALEKAGTVPEQISAQKAAVEQAKASVESIRAQLEKTVLRSPISGVVTRQDAKKGEIAPANTVIASLISASKFEIEANIPEADIAKVKPSNTARVTLDAYGSDVVFEATVAKIDPGETMIEGVATYKTTLQFTKSDDRVRPGMTANIDILTDKRENVIIIPQRAVQSTDGDRFVKISAGNAAPETRKVITGLRGSDGNVEIVEGVKVGEKVITFVQGQ